MPVTTVEAVRCELGMEPLPAQRIAARTGLPIEAVYQALVRLDDERRARMEIDWDATHRVVGWVLA